MLPGVLCAVIGGILLRFVSRENIVYLDADVGTLARRADVSREFVAEELVVYNILARYFAKCSIDTGRSEPVRVVGEVIRCLEKRTR
jgi:hypothetical protein